MHRMTFYPLGNADTTKIDLANGRTLLFDYADMRDPDDEDDLRIDLPAQLRRELGEARRKSFDAVAFTHLDDDHVTGAPDFFHLEHAARYQGGDRIEIEELWVPAAAILEAATALSDDARIIQREARHRFRKGQGVRVFSRPAALKKWLLKHGLTLADRQHLITDAGQTDSWLHPSATTAWNSSSIRRSRCVLGGTVVDRNQDALVVQATFVVSGAETKVILASDIDHEVVGDIVRVTRRNRKQTSVWSGISSSCHTTARICRWAPRRGTLKTEPIPPGQGGSTRTRGQHRARAVSTSKPIPAADTEQPPHRQAANYYRGVVATKSGEFLVTMEHPTAEGTEAARRRDHRIGVRPIRKGHRRRSRPPSLRAHRPAQAGCGHEQPSMAWLGAPISRKDAVVGAQGAVRWSKSFRGGSPPVRSTGRGSRGALTERRSCVSKCNPKYPRIR